MCASARAATSPRQGWSSAIWSSAARAPAAATDAASVQDQIGDVRSAAAADSALVRFGRVLDRHGAFDDTEIAMPGDRHRAEAFLAIREAAPVGVNRRAGEAKRAVDARI